MPMSFPDMESLVLCAKAWRFREPAEGESEESFRAALADFVLPKDSVESHEIRTGKGWDKWTRDEGMGAILASAGRDDAPPPADRAECLAWAKMRAHRLIGLGDLPIRSMLADLAKHPELARSIDIGRMIALTVNTRDERSVRRFIDGFN